MFGLVKCIVYGLFNGFKIDWGYDKIGVENKLYFVEKNLMEDVIECCLRMKKYLVIFVWFLFFLFIDRVELIGILD